VKVKKTQKCYVTTCLLWYGDLDATHRGEMGTFVGGAGWTRVSRGLTCQFYLTSTHGPYLILTCLPRGDPEGELAAEHQKTIATTCRPMMMHFGHRSDPPDAKRFCKFRTIPFRNKRRGKWWMSPVVIRQFYPSGLPQRTDPTLNSAGISAFYPLPRRRIMLGTRL